jgi:spermidine synthase
MVVELVAGRLTGRHLGTSLYTWTSIIGVVLAGMSVGNWLGGRMADRWPHHRLLGWLFLASSIACASCLFLNKLLGDTLALTSVANSVGLGYPGRVFFSMLLIFSAPALALGTISPVTAKMALDRGQAVGRTIGSVYAWGAVGSILGTFLTGFWLIAFLSSTGVIITVAIALSLMGLILGPARIFNLAFLALLVFLLLLTQSSSGWWFQTACTLGLQEGDFQHGKYAPYLYARDSHYQRVRVKQTTFGPHVRALILDNDHHAIEDIQDPSKLGWHYVRIYGALSEQIFRDRTTIDAFFVGGGGFTFPRWVQHRWPGSTCDVAEIDPMVVEACRQAMGLSNTPGMNIHVNDARVVVAQLPNDRMYDLVIGDAFNNGTMIPWQLTTLEFHRELKRHMRPNAVMLTNLIDDYRHGGQLLGAYVHTLQQVFRDVRVFCLSPQGPGDKLRNFIIAASDQFSPAADQYMKSLAPNHTNKSFPGSLLQPEHMAYLEKKSNRLTLTDDHAPVENLISPAITTQKKPTNNPAP